MWSFLGKITKNLTIAIPIIMVSGFVFGIIFNAGFLKGFIIPFTFLMVYPMMVNLNFQKVLEKGDSKAQILTQIINFGIVPFLAYFIGLIFFKDTPYMALGLLLVGLVPTSGMAISWTGFAKGNLEAAVKMMIIGLLLGSIATPFYVKFLMGSAIEINFFKIMQQIAIIVFIPMAAGFITRQSLVKKYGQKEFRQNIGPKFPALSTLGVVGIVFIAMALKAKGIAASPGMLLYILVPLIIIYTFNFIISSLIGKFFLPRGDAIALVYGSVMRNLSISLAIAINAFGQEGANAALVIAIAYIIQVQSAAWYVKFTDKIFGTSDLKKEHPELSIAQPYKDKTHTGKEFSMVADIKKILFATDISKTAKFASRYACSIGNSFNAEVWVIHVISDKLESYSFGAGINVSGTMDKNQIDDFNNEAMEDAKQIIQERIRHTSKKVLEEIPFCPLAEEKVIIKTGNPVDQIVKVAEQDNFDLIIMGTHGHDKFEEIVLGSTANGVMLKSKVPVLVTRPS
ncbi:MAG: universal stress protein [Desulfobacula sp.]|jgi:arsenite transporter|uniref:universal stress protein n=1 Tax=Desulfobacula sp. TaxID=2593537 RepID=UPI001DE8D63F|nr:universal stress protein [Desulfobacula sp.]MBT3485725.1 universal stress protein [Desulfobacula sp.]MBT3805146.1 universal stress protein [Desulfobacula sp.]MBT4024828.1 universal stress protein [Desulfobacula sp.]MBT4198125.1 universal stress protein [Desulfobacula sp.]